MLQFGRIQKIVFCEIPHFTIFYKYFGSQPLQEDWTTLKLLEIIHETKVLRKKVVIFIFKKMYFAKFYI